MGFSFEKIKLLKVNPMSQDVDRSPYGECVCHQCLALSSSLAFTTQILVNSFSLCFAIYLGCHASSEVSPDGHSYTMDVFSKTKFEEEVGPWI